MRPQVEQRCQNQYRESYACSADKFACCQSEPPERRSKRRPEPAAHRDLLRSLTIFANPATSITTANTHILSGCIQLQPVSPEITAQAAAASKPTHSPRRNPSIASIVYPTDTDNLYHVYNRIIQQPLPYRHRSLRSHSCKALAALSGPSSKLTFAFLLPSNVVPCSLRSYISHVHPSVKITTPLVIPRAYDARVLRKLVGL